MDDVSEPVKPQKQIERVTVEDQHKEKLTKLTDEANAALQGIATVTKSDVANMILGNHPDALSSAEIETLKANHVDQVKFAFWVANRLKEARANGESLSLHDILELSQPVMSAPARTPKRPRKKRDKPDQTTDPAPEQE